WGTGGAGPTWETMDLPFALTSRPYGVSTAALDFNPSNPDYVNLGNIGLATTPSTGAVTLSMWIKPNTLGSDTRFFGQLSGGVAQGGAIRSTSGGGLQVWTGAAWITAAPASSISIGNWQHLALVWTNNILQ